MVTTISVIIPALNEEGNIEATVRTVSAAIGTQFQDYEILIFDDGSTDRTGRIADELAKGNPHIRVIHNPQNMGFGHSYIRGVQLACMEYVVMFPGDNEVPLEAVNTILNAIGGADIVVPYISTPQVRPWGRRVVSSAFCGLLNVLFGLSLRYYNGACAHRRVLLQTVSMRTHGFAYMAAILVRLIRTGSSYIEVPMPLQPRQHGRTKAFRLRNIISVLRTIAELVWEVHVIHRSRYAESVQRVGLRA